MNIFEIACWATIEHHPYRTALPNLVLMEIIRESDAGRELEELLFERAAEDAKESLDSYRNHVCFSFSTYTNSNTQVSDDKKLVVMVSDNHISIGVGLKRGCW